MARPFAEVPDGAWFLADEVLWQRSSLGRAIEYINRDGKPIPHGCIYVDLRSAGLVGSACAVITEDQAVAIKMAVHHFRDPTAWGRYFWRLMEKHDDDG